MKFNYQNIRALAHEMGVNVTELLALSPANDPFYAAVPHRDEAAKWFAELWDRFRWGQGVHLRRTHYVIVSQARPVLKPNGEPYQNTEVNWKFLGIASLAARYLKLVPAGSFVDRRNPDPLIYADLAGNRDHTWSVEIYPGQIDGRFSVVEAPHPPEIRLTDIAYLLGFSAWQPYVVEVWVEKSTMNDILELLARRLGFNLITGVGEQSETAARNAVGRAIEARRPVHIIYLSDFDPAGRSMPVAIARKIEFILSEELGADDVHITLNPLLLTPEQVTKYKLPRTPIKETEKRAARFEERFGEGAVELDALEALHPGELERLVKLEVERYLDPTLSGRVSHERWAREKKLEELVASIRERHAPAIEEFTQRFAAVHTEIEEALGEANAIAAQFHRIAIAAQPLVDAIHEEIVTELPEGDQFGVPQARPARPVTDPLFDSKRDYVSQADAYHEWQGR